jgi:hypothetical protein
MQLSYESYRTRWFILVAVWSLCAFAHFSQIRVVRNYLDIASQLGNRGSIYARTPLIQIYPAFGADAQTWVRHSLSLVEGKQLRLRSTTIDNAPKGREVHWNSAWAWMIAGAGRIREMFTGEPLAIAIERATLWLGPTVLFSLTVLLSAWATSRAGVAVGIVVAAAMTCNDRIYEGFFPTYVDHHGLLTTSVFGLMLGAVFMGGGWWRERKSGEHGILPDSPASGRRAAIFSGFCGACGLWVSAASAVPPVALVGPRVFWSYCSKAAWLRRRARRLNRHSGGRGDARGRSSVSRSTFSSIFRIISDCGSSRITHYIRSRGGVPVR